MDTHLDLLHTLNALNTPDIWLIVAGIGFIVVLMSVLVIGRRLNHVWEELAELGQLQRATPRADSYQVPTFAPEGPHASPLTLHLQQIKRQQLLVLDELKRAQGASQAVAELSRHLAIIERRQSQLLEALADVSTEVQQWKARLTTLGAEVAPLLESDAIADFVTHVDVSDA
jgi:predicted nuclease with TOPRIM domain